MKLKHKYEYILFAGHNYEVALETEHNLLVECVSWFVALVVTVGLFYLYSLTVCPDILNYIITFLSNLA